MSSFWKIRKFWRSPVRHSGGHTFMLYSFWFCRSPQFKPGHHTFHPALYVIALPYRQVGHFVEDLLEFKGEKLLADQREIEGKSEESDWFR